jgi:hypothetical protein
MRLAPSFRAGIDDFLVLFVISLHVFGILCPEPLAVPSVSLDVLPIVFAVPASRCFGHSCRPLTWLELSTTLLAFLLIITPAFFAQALQSHLSVRGL